MLNKDVFLNPLIFDKDVEQVPTRNGYGEALIELGTTDPSVVVLTADLAESTRVLAFADQFPERFIECGVAEQNMTGIAAGLAMAGKIPFVSSYAVFSPGRAWDQVRVSICYNDAPVKIAGAHTGISVGPDGATHQALEDIAIMRTLPNMVVLAPADAEETRKATLAAARYPGPVYFRFAREATPVITTAESPFEIGRAEVVWTPKKGQRAETTLIASGPLLAQALTAAHELDKRGIPTEVINNHTIKPLDTRTIVASARTSGSVVTIEEHQMQGGMGSAVAECLVSHFPVPIEFIGMPNSFGESGEPAELLEKYGMTAQDIIEAVHRVMRRKHQGQKQ